MSTPENEPQTPQTPPAVPSPPQYGQVAPEGQNPQPGAPQQNPYGQNPYGQQPAQNPYGQNPNPYGQPPQAPTPYGQQPYGGGFPVPPQGNFPAPQIPTERPKELNIAFWAIIAAGLVSVLSALFGFTDEIIRSQISMVPDFDTIISEAGISVAEFISMVKTMVVVMSLVSLIIYVLIAFMVRKGSNVARIFATVFAALSLVSLSASPLAILAVVLGIVGVVFAWLRPSSNYIAARRAARAAGFR